MFDHLAATPETSKGRLFKENDSDHNRSPYEKIGRASCRERV